MKAAVCAPRNPAEGPIMLSIGFVGVLCNILCLAVLQKQQVQFGGTDKLPRQITAVSIGEKAIRAGASDSDSVYNVVAMCDVQEWACF